MVKTLNLIFIIIQLTYIQPPKKCLEVFHTTVYNSKKGKKINERDHHVQFIHHCSTVMRNNTAYYCIFFSVWMTLKHLEQPILQIKHIPKNIF